MTWTELFEEAAAHHIDLETVLETVSTVRENHGETT